LVLVAQAADFVELALDRHLIELAEWQAGEQRYSVSQQPEGGREGPALFLVDRWKTSLAIHPDAGHDLPLDDAAWVARQVRDWLAAGA
jgi:hypothetical protein